MSSKNTVLQGNKVFDSSYITVFEPSYFYNAYTVLVKATGELFSIAETTAWRDSLHKNYDMCILVKLTSADDHDGTDLSECELVAAEDQSDFCWCFGACDWSNEKDIYEKINKYFKNKYLHKK